MPSTAPAGADGRAVGTLTPGAAIAVTGWVVVVDELLLPTVEVLLDVVVVVVVVPAGVVAVVAVGVVVIVDPGELVVELFDAWVDDVDDSGCIGPVMPAAIAVAFNTCWDVCSVIGRTRPAAAVPFMVKAGERVGATSSHGATIVADTNTAPA